MTAPSSSTTKPATMTDFPFEHRVWVKFDDEFWPGQVWRPDDPTLRPEVHHARRGSSEDTLIRFFGTWDFSWIRKKPGDNIFDFEEGFARFGPQQQLKSIARSQRATFQDAVLAAKERRQSQGSVRGGDLQVDDDEEDDEEDEEDDDNNENEEEQEEGAKKRGEVVDQKKEAKKQVDQKSSKHHHHHHHRHNEKPSEDSSSSISRTSASKKRKKESETGGRDADASNEADAERAKKKKKLVKREAKDSAKQEKKHKKEEHKHRHSGDDEDEDDEREKKHKKEKLLKQHEDDKAEKKKQKQKREKSAVDQSMKMEVDEGAKTAATTTDNKKQQQKADMMDIDAAKQVAPTPTADKTRLPAEVKAEKPTSPSPQPTTTTVDSVPSAAVPAPVVPKTVPEPSCEEAPLPSEKKSTPAPQPSISALETSDTNINEEAVPPKEEFQPQQADNKPPTRAATTKKSSTLSLEGLVDDETSDDERNRKALQQQQRLKSSSVQRSLTSSPKLESKLAPFSLKREPTTQQTRLRELSAAEVGKIKAQLLEAEAAKNAAAAKKQLEILSKTTLSCETLATTKIGKVVRAVQRKFLADPPIQTLSKKLFDEWTLLAKKGSKPSQSSSSSSATAGASSSTTTVISSPPLAALPTSKLHEQFSKASTETPLSPAAVSSPEGTPTRSLAKKSSDDNVPALAKSLPSSSSVSSLASLNGTSSSSTETELSKQLMKDLELTGHQARDYCRKSLADTLLVSKPSDPTVCCRLAVEIESQLLERFTGHISTEYKDTFRSINSNLKRNQELLENVLDGTITPKRLCHMTSEEMATKELQQQIARIREYKAAEMRSDWKKQQQLKQGSSSIFRCSKCKGRKILSSQMQTRGADEPMTVFLHCVECDHRWRQ